MAMKCRAMLRALPLIISTLACSASLDQYNLANIDRGCYQWNDTSSIYPPGNYDPNDLTPYKCVVMCAAGDGKLASLTNGEVCLCLDTVSGLSTSCNQPCTGDPSANCGGPTSIRVYNLSTLVRSEPRLDFNGAVEFLQTSQFQVNVDSETTSSVYQITQKSTASIDSALKLQFGSPYSYKFTSYGSDVPLTVVAFGETQQIFHSNVEVNASPSVSNIECPIYVAVGSAIQCTGRLQLGKEVNMTWFLDGSSGVISHADPVSWYIGDPVPRWTIIFNDVDPGDGLLISLTSAVIHPVVVHGWEMNVVDAGTVDIVVVRPSCGVGKTYCATRSCCEVDNEFLSQLCNQESSFCGTTNIGDSSNISCSFSDINNPVPLFDNYKIIYSATLDVKTGYSTKILTPDERFEYLPGDLVGWIKTPASALFAIDSSHGEFSVLENFASPPAGVISLTSKQQNNKSNGNILLSGIASQPSDFIVNVNALSLPGNKNITFTHKSKEKSVSTTKSISALIPVGNVSFTNARNSCSIYGPLGEPFNISVTVDSGSNVEVTWKVNGISVISSGWKQNFTFSILGEYPLTTSVTNAISGKLLVANVIIEQKISGLRASKSVDKQVAFQGLDIRLKASILTGSNVTYTWYFGDGSDSVSTTHSTVDHTYHKTGILNTTVEATNMVSSSNYSFLIDVMNPVEIVIPPVTTSNVSNNLTCRLNGSLLDSYRLVIEVDDSFMLSTNCTTIQYSFTPGHHVIHCHIHVAIVVYSNISLFVFEPITGLSILDVPPLVLDTAYTVNANITTGNNVSYQWRALDKTYKGNPTSVTFTSVGNQNLSVNASNAVSWKTEKIMVIVQERIGKLKITPSSSPAKVGSLMSFQIKPTAGSEIKYSYKVGNGSYQNVSFTATITYTFTQEGIHSIFINASNLISSSNTTYTIAAQVPVTNRPKITCPSVLHNAACVVRTNGKVNFAAEIPYATNITYIWSWGSTADTSHKGSPSKKQPSKIVSSQDIEFADVGQYNVTAIAQNNVSSLLGWLFVETLDEVTGFSFDVPQTVAVKENIKVKTKITTGSNVTYAFDSGHNASAQNMIRGKDAVWMYPQIGVYRIRGNASNLVSWDDEIRYISVQEEVIAVKLSPVRPVETSKPTEIKWIVIGGTNVTSEVHFGDGATGIVEYTNCQENVNTSSYICNITHDWSKADSYEVIVTAFNRLTTKKNDSVLVSVQDRITYFKVEVGIAPEYFVHNSISCNFSNDGINVRYQVLLKDDENRVENTTNTIFAIKYYKTGTYTPVFKAYNDISVREYKELTVVVKAPLEPEEITILEIIVESTTFSDKTEFKFNYRGTLFTCSIDFGDGSSKRKLSEEDVSKGVSYLYQRSGKFKVKLTCRNSKGSFKEKTAETFVFVQIPLNGFKAKERRLLAVYQKEIIIAFSWLNGSDLSVVAFAKDKQNRQATLYNYTLREGSITLPSDYFLSPGTYILYVNASNSVSSLDEPVELSVRVVQLLKGVKLLCNPYVPVSYGLRAYLSVKEGSDMNVTWNFGDGSPNNYSKCSWKGSCYQDHVYEKIGNYTINAHAENELSENESNVTVVIEYPVFGWNFTSFNVSQEKTPSEVRLIYNNAYPFPTDASYFITFFDERGKITKEKKNLTEGSSVSEMHTFTKAGCYKAEATLKNKVSVVKLETEIKVRGNYREAKITAKSLKTESDSRGEALPVEYPVDFSSNIDNDCLKFNWTIRNNSDQIIHVPDSKDFQYKFDNIGTYHIDFVAYDETNSNRATKEISVDESVTGLYFSSDGVGEVNKKVQFVLLWATLGKTTEFKVDFGDNTGIQDLNLDEKKRNFDAYREKLPFDPTGFEGILFSHNFTTVATYTVKVKVKSGQILSNQLDISKAPCPLPIITVDGGSKDATRAPRVPYETQYTLFSRVDAEGCSDSIQIEFQWSVFKADQHLLDLLKKTGTSVVPPDEDMRINFTATPTNESTLSIPRKTLEPGLYIFELNAKLPKVDAKFQNIVYLNFDRPALIVEIEGGSARTIAWNREFELNANSSVDPLTDSNDKLLFEWKCKMKERNEKRGCFGAGEKLSEFKEERIARFRSKLLLEGITYQFTVTVRDHDGFSESYTQEISAIEGTPPQLKLRCVSNCASRVNPEARLSITSECLDNCDGLKYEWSFINDSSPRTTYDIWPNKTLTAKTSASLVVKAGTFQRNETYTFTVKVTNKDSETEGSASYKVVTNSPPYNGDCVFLPINGTSMETNFNFSCYDWKDDATNPDEVLWYRVFYVYGLGDERQNFLLYHGPKSSVSGLQLPAASKKNSYTFDVSIQVEDAFNAFTSRSFNITVYPAPKKNLQELQNSTKAVEKLLGSGDIQAANRLAVALVKEIEVSEEKKKEKTQEEKEQKNEIFDSIVKNIAEKLPDNLDSMRQSIETIALVVALQDDVPQSTQANAVNALLKTSQKLKSGSEEDIGNDVIEDVALNILSGVGNLLQASSDTQAKLVEKHGNQTIPKSETKTIDTNIQTALKAVTDVSDSILKRKVTDEKDVLVKTVNLEASLRRSSSESINGSSVKFSNKTEARINFPSQFDVKRLGGGDVVDVVALYIHANPYKTYNTSRLVDSGTVSLELKHKNGEVLSVSNLDEDLEIIVPRQAENNTVTINKTETKLKELVVHILELNSLDNAFSLEIVSEQGEANITIYCRKEKAPTLDAYDFNQTFQATAFNFTKHQYFLENETLRGGKYYIGIASQINGENVKVNYTFQSYELGCYYWAQTTKMWTTYGCTPARPSTETAVHCSCNHATLFGSNFLVAPNKLDVGKQLKNLANLADYPALLATICVVGGLYLIAMIWALRKDRKESFKSSLHCAADNEPGDRQKYEVTLFTGSRRGAGSTAEVSIIITGDDGDSEPRLLQRTSSLSFKRTSQDSYLVTTPLSLGSLQYIRIWHDNSGSDPSWFLSEIVIRDVEAGEQYIFLCNSWLACDEGDGLVERLVPVAGPEELKDFQYLFMQNSKQGFNDGHLWFSIVLRPAQSRFTHAQRVTCCLCLLLCSMLVNAMFFRVAVAAENNVEVDVGPYQFTWHEIIVGIQSSLIVFPVNLIIVGIFRRIAAKPQKNSKYVQGRKKPKNAKGVAISLGDIEMEKSKKNKQKKNEKDQVPEVETRRMRLLPWWFVFIAWFLVIAVTVTAAFFTILYGLQFGKRRQEQWLTALLVSVFKDVLVLQPVKIMAFSLFVAFVIRKPNSVAVNEENDKLIQNEDWIQEEWSKANAHGIVRAKAERKPPDELLLRKMRLFRVKERKMFGVFHEVLQYFFFWWIVLMIAYGYREPDAHRLTTSMKKIFTNLGGDNEQFSFKRGTKHDDIYLTRNRRDLLMWVRDVIIPGLYHEKWYNNMTDRHKKFLSDGVGYLIGSPRLRLLRIKKDTCEAAEQFENIIDGCESEYSFSDEYQVKYNRKNWVATNESLSGEENDEWQYRTQSELYERPYWAKLATYRGGGYVLKLNDKKDGAVRQLEELDDTWWIDGQTRAVFVEFTSFYPGKNLHCIVTILFECPASGGCSASFQILATRLDELIGNYRIFVLACEFVFVVCIAIFTYKAFKEMLQKGSVYWYQFWNWVEMSIIAVGWTCLAFYILRFIANKWTKAKFNDNPGNFVSFRYVATADQLYGIILAFLVFLTSVKFIRLFRFNRRMSMLGSTLRYAAWDILNFLILFSVAFMAFCSIAYLLFQTNIDMFSSFLTTMETLLDIILGKFKYMNLNHDTFVSSAVVLSIYCVVVVFILMNVFLVILNEAFKVVKSNNDLQENEYEIVDYMTSRFKSWLGVKTKPSPNKSDFEHEYGFKPTYAQPISKKYQLPATAILDRKLQELLDFVEKQAREDDMENILVDKCEDDATKKKAILLLMS